MKPRILLTALLLAVSVSAQSIKQPELKRTECKVEADPKVESNRVLVCFDEDTETEFPITVGANHLWAKFLDDTQAGVSTVVIEGHDDRVCLAEVRIQDGWVKHPVNAQHKNSDDVCVSVNRSRKPRL